MDPTSLVSQVPEMWQFPMVGVPPLPQLAAAGRRMGRIGLDGAAEDSTVTEQSGGGSRAAASRRKRKDFAAGSANAAAAGVSEDESSKLVSTSSGNELTDNEGAKGLKIRKSTNENRNIKTEAEASSGMNNKLNDQNDQPSEPPKQDFIHVRARRGQATDSHSLAERARREKISERMKILQDLVPGCNKVIGKASVLDEIINYVQALQRQVEFLSMKLEAVTSRMNTEMEVLPPKDFGAQTYDTTYSLEFNSQATREYEQGSAAEWLHMQVGGAFERVS